MNFFSDLEHLRQKQVDQETENMNLASQSQEMMSINMQLQSTVMKAQAKQIDLELRKLDATQANDRLSYIQVRNPFRVNSSCTRVHGHVISLICLMHS